MNARAVVPDFEPAATGKQRFQLSAFKDPPRVLDFPPNDMAPRIAREWRAVKVPGRAVPEHARTAKP